MAAAAAAPPPGVGARIAAPYDSPTRDKGRVNDWRAKVMAYLSRNQGYPAQALQNGIEGRVIVKLSIDANGRVLVVQLYRTSGEIVLDQHTVTMIKRRSPLPKPPDEILGGDSSLSLLIPVDFNIARYRKGLRKAL
ncbi:hypothetical protein AAEX37_00539 [Oligella sp. MSHR50489EDL]|uniref:energy transducer TonB n=1 Tax=Oligella sp. MSHR50489EDL TaxID=3139409 RepID=UPI003D815B7A